jgi:hypothetical protein
MRWLQAHADPRARPPPRTERSARAIMAAKVWPNRCLCAFRSFLQSIADQRRPSSLLLTRNRSQRLLWVCGGAPACAFQSSGARLNLRSRRGHTGRRSYDPHTIRISDCDVASGGHTGECRCRGPAHTDAEPKNGKGLRGLPKGSRCRVSNAQDHPRSNEPLSAFRRLYGKTWFSSTELPPQQEILIPQMGTPFFDRCGPQIQTVPLPHGRLWPDSESPIPVR